MNELKVEIVSVHHALMPLCANGTVLLKALTADPLFSLKAGKLTYSAGFCCEYSSSDWFNVDDKLGVLHSFVFKTEHDVSEANCDAFATMLKAFRTNLRTLEAVRIETLWDDVSFRYCRLAYPIILNTENQMRRLITQFMLKNLGARWIELSAPKEVRDQIGKSKRTIDESDPLHNVDFDTLVDYLTKPYASDTADSMHKFIRSLEITDPEKAKESIDRLKTMVPQSNWSRYFSQIVDCEDTLLRSKWDDLYVLRCKVAHNTYLTAEEFARVQLLSSELDKITTSALAKLGQVKVSDEDAANLETMATELTGDVAEVGPTDISVATPTRRPRSILRGRLRIELERLFGTLREVAVAVGEPGLDDGNIFQLQGAMLRAGILRSDENQIIDTAMEMATNNKLDYPASSVEAITKQILKMRVEKMRHFNYSQNIHIEHVSLGKFQPPGIERTESS